MPEVVNNSRVPKVWRGKKLRNFHETSFCNKCGTPVFGSRPSCVNCDKDAYYFDDAIPDELRRIGVSTFRTGVFSLILYRGEMYVISAQTAENAGKQEMVFEQGEVVKVGNVADAVFELLGGGVKPGETPNQAMGREAIEEIQAIVEEANGDINKFWKVFAELSFTFGDKVEDFIVSQWVETPEETIFRGAFEIIVYNLLLTDDQFEFLEQLGAIKLLSELENEGNIGLLRPYIQAYLHQAGLISENIGTLVQLPEQEMAELPN